MGKDVLIKPKKVVPSILSTCQWLNVNNVILFILLPAVITQSFDTTSSTPDPLSFPEFYLIIMIIIIIININ